MKYVVLAALVYSMVSIATSHSIHPFALGQAHPAGRAN